MCLSSDFWKYFIFCTNIGFLPIDFVNSHLSNKSKTARTHCSSGFKFGCGSRIWTYDLRVMRANLRFFKPFETTWKTASQCGFCALALLKSIEISSLVLCQVWPNCDQKSRWENGWNDKAAMYYCRWILPVIFCRNWAYCLPLFNAYHCTQILFHKLYCLPLPAWRIWKTIHKR